MEYKKPTVTQLENALNSIMGEKDDPFHSDGTGRLSVAAYQADE
jgi:hypothetical protein